MKDAQDPRFVGKSESFNTAQANGGGPAAAAAAGCVCPPGANLACERPDCPRKPLPGGGAKGFVPGEGGDLMMKGGR